MITSPKTREFLTSLLDRLDEADCDPILLRNYENFPDEIGNDLDIYVRSDALSRAFSIFRFTALMLGGTIVHVHRRGYFIAIWVRFTDSVNSLHVDLYHGATTWHGMRYLSDEELVKKSQPATALSNFRIPAPYHEALISTLASILWGSFFKSTYQDRINILLEKNESRSHFSEIMRDIFGVDGDVLTSAIISSQAYKIVDRTFAQRLRNRLFSHCFKISPFKCCFNWLMHWYEEFACYAWRLPGMVVEYDEGVWHPNDIEFLNEVLAPYFGATHSMTSGRLSLYFLIKTRRLRGINHLILLRSNRFAVNRKSFEHSTQRAFPDVTSISEYVIKMLETRINKQYRI